MSEAGRSSAGPSSAAKRVATRSKRVASSSPTPTPENPTPKKKRGAPQPKKREEEPSTRWDLSKYRVIYDEAAGPTWVPAGNPSIDDLTVPPNIYAVLQHTPPSPLGESAAVYGKGYGIFVSHAAYVRIPMHLRPPKDGSHTGDIPVRTNFQPLKSCGAAFLPIVFREANTGHSIVVRIQVKIVPGLPVDIFFGADTPILGNGECERNEEMRQLQYTFNFPNEEVLEAAGPLPPQQG